MEPWTITLAAQLGVSRLSVSLLVMEVHESFASSNSDNEWSITDCLDIYLNNKLESKGTLYGHIDGDDDFRSFINKLRDQGVGVTEMPEEPKLVNKPLSAVPEIEVVNSERAKFMFDWKAGNEYVSYGSPFYFSDEKAVFCQFKNKNTKSFKHSEYTVKFYVKVMKLYENYKILSDNPKISDKRKMVMILRYALDSQKPPPVPLTRYIIGVPLYHRLQVEGKGNMVKFRKNKSKDIENEDKPQKLAKQKPKTDKNKSIKHIKTVSQKNPMEIKNTVNCHWSDSTEIMIPNALSNQNNPMLNKHNDSPPESSNTNNNCHENNKFNEPILSSEALTSASLPVTREPSIGDAQSQSLMHAASCLVNDLPLLLNETDLDINTSPTIELHTVTNLDMHTGASIELQSEPNLLTPLHNPNFNIQISPNYNLDLSPAASLTASPNITPKKEKKKSRKRKSKEQSELVKKAQKISSSSSPVKITITAPEITNNHQSTIRNSFKDNNAATNTEITNDESDKNGNGNGNVKIRKKIPANKRYSLEEIVKSQEQLRSKLKSIHDMSFRCDNVPCLDEITSGIKTLGEKLKSCLPPSKSRKIKLLKSRS